jgi:hypothetical protein
MLKSLENECPEVFHLDHQIYIEDIYAYRVEEQSSAILHL